MNMIKKKKKRKKVTNLSDYVSKGNSSYAIPDSRCLIFLPYCNFWIHESTSTIFGRKADYAKILNSHNMVTQSMTQKLHAVPKPFCFNLPGTESQGIPLQLLNSEEVAASWSISRSCLVTPHLLLSQAKVALDQKSAEEGGLEGKFRGRLEICNNFQC